MLTGKLVRVRSHRNTLICNYLDPKDARWIEAAERLLDMFRHFEDVTRDEAEGQVAEVLGEGPTQLIHQGLAKLLFDRCDFGTESPCEPSDLRSAAFAEAARTRAEGTYDREAVLKLIGMPHDLEPEVVESAMFADLKGEQRLSSFRDFSADQLLARYNTALAQAVLLRAVQVRVKIEGEGVKRFRELLRAAKFHRLIVDAKAEAEGITLVIDGPMSLFSATQKYGMQLASFLPSILHCKKFELAASIRWGTQRKECDFKLDHRQGLKSHTVDYGDYRPKELASFEESFRKQVPDWTIDGEPQLERLHAGWWIPDFTLTHRATGKIVHLEILGYWRRTDTVKHLTRLRSELKSPFLVAMSDAMNQDETADAAEVVDVYRFRATPLPKEVQRLAALRIGVR